MCNQLKNGKSAWVWTWANVSNLPFDLGLDVVKLVDTYRLSVHSWTFRFSSVKTNEDVIQTKELSIVYSE